MKELRYVITQQSGAQGLITGAVVLQPAFGGGDLAILLGMAILRNDEFRTQRDGLRLARSNNHRSDGIVKVGDLSVIVLDVRTVLAVNLLRGEIPCAIQSDQSGVMHPFENVEHALFFQGVVNAVKNREELFGRDWIEHFANPIITGNLLDLKKALGVARALGFIHAPLIGKKGGRLGEEDRKSARGKILHGIACVVPNATVRKGSGHSAKSFDQLTEFEQAHAQSRRR